MLATLLPRSALALLLGTGPAWAQELAGDASRGEALAEKWCADCHEVAPGSRGPTWSEVPTFQAVADDPAVTETALRAFLQTPHQNMPDLRPTAEQSDDLVAYILGLKGWRP